MRLLNKERRREMFNDAYRLQNAQYVRLVLRNHFFVKQLTQTASNTN